MPGQTGIDAHGGSNGAGDVAAAATTLVADGYTFAAQYIDQNDTNENPASPTYAQSADGAAGASLTYTEAQTEIAAGLQIVSIFETNGEAVSPYTYPFGQSNSDAQIVSYLTTTQGTADGAEALASARAIGQPTGSAIYFALDFDPGPGGYTPGAQQAVENYLKGVSAALAGSGYQIGVYGAAQTLQWATTADPANNYTPSVTYTWLSGSTGWAGYGGTGNPEIPGPNGDPTTHGWTMIQSIPPDGTVAAGTTLPVDYDTAAANQPFGAWDTQNPACYCQGTLIRTERGDVPVEELAIGDRVVTYAGVLEPIRWIGRRSYAGRFLAGKRHLLPICIRAGALADSVPRRDLLVSPKHAMYLDGVLVPAGLLVNGASVVQVESAESVHYFHIELSRHDMIWVEGAASETFVDDDSRAVFHNAHEYYARYPKPVSGPALYCAPRIEDGYALEAIRQRIAERAGMLRHGPNPGALRGFLDHVSGNEVRGWAQNAARPDAPVCLDVLIDGVPVAQTLANLYREDLQRAGLGSGRHGFAVRLAAPLTATGVLEVRRSADAALLARVDLAIRPAMAA